MTALAWGVLLAAGLLVERRLVAGRRLELLALLLQLLLLEECLRPRRDGRAALGLLLGPFLHLQVVEPGTQIVVVRKYLSRLAEMTQLAVCSGNHDLDARTPEGERRATWLGDLADAGVADRLRSRGPRRGAQSEKDICRSSVVLMMVRSSPRSMLALSPWSSEPKILAVRPSKYSTGVSIMSAPEFHSTNSQRSGSPSRAWTLANIV